jgi:hypothetical protein
MFREILTAIKYVCIYKKEKTQIHNLSFHDSKKKSKLNANKVKT